MFDLFGLYVIIYGIPFTNGAKVRGINHEYDNALNTCFICCFVMHVLQHYALYWSLKKMRENKERIRFAVLMVVIYSLFFTSLMLYITHIDLWV